MNSWRWWPENNLPITGKWSNAIAKAAPSNKQNDIVAIVASSRYFSFVFLFVPKNTCPPTTSHVLHGNIIQDPVLPVDYQVKKSAFFFISEMPLQSTCFQTQFYLTVFSSITYTTFHFEALCHSRKIPPKSFISSSLCFPLSLSRQVHTFTFLHLAIFFPILPPHFSPFRKSIFDFKLTCNWILFKLPPSLLYARPIKGALFFLLFKNICHSCHSFASSSVLGLFLACAARALLFFTHFLFSYLFLLPSPLFLITTQVTATTTTTTS